MTLLPFLKASYIEVILFTSLKKRYGLKIFTNQVKKYLKKLNWLEINIPIQFIIALFVQSFKKKLCHPAILFYYKKAPDMSNTHRVPFDYAGGLCSSDQRIP